MIKGETGSLVFGPVSMRLAKTKHFSRSEEMIWRVLVHAVGGGEGKLRNSMVEAWSGCGGGMPVEREWNKNIIPCPHETNCRQNGTHFVFKVSLSHLHILQLGA